MGRNACRRESLLEEVYHLLHTATAEAGVDEAYLEYLHRALGTALRAEQKGGYSTLLPLLVCEAAGGDPCRAVPATAAWKALHIAAQLLDDVEDGDVERWSSASQDPPRIVNLATGFIALSNLVLSTAEGSLDARLRLILLREFNQTVMQMAGGQHIDLSGAGPSDLEMYFRMIGAKSGAFFALAARCGAMCADSGPALIDQYGQFGYNVGMLIQIADDLSDFRKARAQSDLVSGRRTLPLLYALAVASPDQREEIATLFAQAPSDDEAASHLLEAVLSLGAQTYAAVGITYYWHEALKSLPSEGKTKAILRHWLEDLVRSIKHETVTEHMRSAGT